VALFFVISERSCFSTPSSVFDDAKGPRMRKSVECLPQVPAAVVLCQLLFALAPAESRLRARGKESGEEIGTQRTPYIGVVSLVLLSTIV
jgi:hypothetical protein